MDDARYQEARRAYDSGDYRSAAKLFLAAAGEGTDGNGAAYHMAGNALIRLRRYSDAVTVYGHALSDEVYSKHGAVYANRASAQAALGDYADAIASYEAALEDTGYRTPYKALQGLASALLEMGRTEEAAAAYRRAALDETNPNPGAALVNLGLCFMALGRPADAVEAYQAALGFDGYAGRGKALANLGQSYHALGRDEEAVRSFDKAINLHGHTLSAAALADYKAASAATEQARETVEGWLTGDMPPLIELGGEGDGWDASGLAALSDSDGGGSAAAPYERADVSAAGGVGAGVIDDDDEVRAFLSRTEDEMRVQDRELRRAERVARRGERNVWKPVLAIVLALALLAVLLGVLFYSGYGWPTQKQTTKALLSAQQEGRAIGLYWVAVPERDVRKEMAKIPPMKSFTVDSVDRSSTTSTASVTVTPEGGAALHYQISLQREGVGWKVTGIENDWGSSGGGS